MERDKVMPILRVVSELFVFYSESAGKPLKGFLWRSHKILFMILEDHYDACRRIVIIPLHTEVKVWLASNYPSIRTR